VTALALAIFCGTYLLIAARRLRWLPIGRPAGALLGAVLMVATGVLTPQASYDAIDLDTILLLFGMMLLTAQYAEAGFFPWIAATLLARDRDPVALLRALCWLAGILSALLVNDTVCLFFTPMVLLVCRQRGLPYAPYLLALATSSNIGSAATLVGNPQNMLIGAMSGMPFLRFLAWSAPAALIGLACNSWMLERWYGAQLRAVPKPSGISVEPAGVLDVMRLRIAGIATLGVLIAFASGAHLGYAALAGGVLALVLDRRDPMVLFQRIDWTLLVFFASLFVVVGGLESTGLVHQAWDSLAPTFRFSTASGLAAFATAMTFGSNVVSNVPMVLLTGPYL